MGSATWRWLRGYLGSEKRHLEVTSGILGHHHQLLCGRRWHIFRTSVSYLLLLSEFAEQGRSLAKIFKTLQWESLEYLTGSSTQQQQRSLFCPLACVQCAYDVQLHSWQTFVHHFRLIVYWVSANMMYILCCNLNLILCWVIAKARLYMMYTLCFTLKLIVCWVRAEARPLPVIHHRDRSLAALRTKSIARLYIIPGRHYQY